jgi:hypothetical protein
MIELAMVVLTGVAHVSLELWSDGMRGAAESLGRPQHYFNLAAVIGWGSYLAWQMWATPGIVGELGLGRRGFLRTLKQAFPFVVLGEVVMIGFGVWWYGLRIPAAFWLVFLVYPLWGIAQQFALQAMVTRNIGVLVESLPLKIIAVAAIFSMSHFPNYSLMALTLVAGVAFTWLYIRCRNIWAIGILHGIMGATAYYFVLGLDPGIKLLEIVGRG